MSLASLSSSFFKRLFGGAAKAVEREAGGTIAREASHVAGGKIASHVARSAAADTEKQVSRSAAQVLGRDALVRRGEVAMRGKVLRSAANQAGLEGGHIAKELKLDQAGQKWMAKGFKFGQEHRAVGDKVGSDVTRALGLETPVIHMREATLQGKRQMATLQRFVEHSGERLPLDPHQLTKKQVDQLTETQVARWLIGDHDGKINNFLLKKNGDVMAIDFGNMYRHFPTDVLAKGYVPNWEEPVYNRIWNAYAKGTLNVDMLPALAMVSKIEQMADDDFLKLIKPYVEARYLTDDIPAQLPNVARFLEAALDRKQTIRETFTGFFDGLARERGLTGGFMEALRLK